MREQEHPIRLQLAKDGIRAEEAVEVFPKSGFVDENGRNLRERVTLFAAPRKRLYRVDSAQLLLEKVHQQLPEAGRSDFVIQGSKKTSAVRFGKLYTQEKLPAERNKNSNLRAIDIRL